MEMTNTVALLNLVEFCDSENSNLALEEESSQNLVKKYREFEDKINSGNLGKTAQFKTSDMLEKERYMWQGR